MHPFVPPLLRRHSFGKEGAPGRRSRAFSAQGSTIRAVKDGHGINVVGTILAAADRGATIKAELIDFRPHDLRGSLRQGMESNLIVFVVDSSGSMAGKDRLQAVTGAVVSLLNDAYQRRDKVAVITVRGNQPQLLLPPTRSTLQARRTLDGAPTGGRTPLALGLAQAHELIEREYRKDPNRRALLVVLSDGRDTTKLGTAGVRQAATVIAETQRAGCIVIDCERTSRIQLGLAKDLATHLQAVCVRLDALTGDNVAGVIGAL